MVLFQNSVLAPHRSQSPGVSPLFSPAPSPQPGPALAPEETPRALKPKAWAASFQIFLSTAIQPERRLGFALNCTGSFASSFPHSTSSPLPPKSTRVGDGTLNAPPGPGTTLRSFPGSAQPSHLGPRSLQLLFHQWVRKAWKPCSFLREHSASSRNLEEQQAHPWEQSWTWKHLDFTNLFRPSGKSRGSEVKTLMS